MTALTAEEQLERKRAAGREAQRRYRERHGDALRASLRVAALSPEQLEKKRAVDRKRGARYRTKNPERYNELTIVRAKKYRERDPVRQRGIQLKCNHGITLDDYEAMFTAQGGVCAICQTNPHGEKPLHVDHCHTTGKVRGLLCRACNTGLGLFQDDQDRLETAINYLRK